MYGLEPARFLDRDGRVARGIKQVVPVANPAAGAELAVTVPGGEQWIVLAGMFTFTASAAVANRTVHLVVQVDSAQVFATVDPTAITAAGVVNYNVVMCNSPSVVSTSVGVGTLRPPLMPLPQGSRLLTSTTALDLADQYSAVNLYVARYYLPDQKLDEIAELEQLAYFDAMRKAGVAIGG